MGRKVFLPLTQRFSDSLEKPTAAAMRERLGGRPSGHGSVDVGGRALTLGSFVALEGTGRIGVLLAVADASVDVYVDRGTVKRTLVTAIREHHGERSQELEDVAASIGVFGGLAEGQQVSVERSPGEIVTGTLVEKCRYGGIVELEDRSTLAVGFKKLWPSTTAASRPS